MSMSDMSCIIVKVSMKISGLCSGPVRDFLHPLNCVGMMVEEPSFELSNPFESLMSEVNAIANDL